MVLVCAYQQSAYSLRENMAVPDEKTSIRLTQLAHGGG